MDSVPGGRDIAELLKGIDRRNSCLTDGVTLRLIEWDEETAPARFDVLQNVAELRARPLSKLRIILAPVDVPTQGNWQAHLDLFDALQVPAAFIQERVQNVCTSFGSQFRLGDGCSAVWFHSLFKAIELDSLGRVKAGHGLDLNVNPGLSVSQANFDWYKSAFFLSWTRVVDKPTSLTLCCWSAPLELETALEALFQHGDPTVLLKDPFTLLATAAHELYLELNQQVARMATAHGRLESDTLSLAAATAQSGRTVTFDFVGLSNISKHIIHLGEGTRGALGTIDAMLECHGEMAGLFDEDSRSETRQKLRHTRMMLRSTELQMASLEKRVQNLTSLAFNSVAQYNNQVLLLDSLNMRTIAVVTLCFLPMTALASIFETPFFSMSDMGRIQVHTDFWILWVIAVPLTLGVVLVWRAFMRLAVEKQHGRKDNTRFASFINSSV